MAGRDESPHRMMKCNPKPSSDPVSGILKFSDQNEYMTPIQTVDVFSTQADKATFFQTLHAMFVPLRT